MSTEKQKEPRGKMAISEGVSIHGADYIGERFLGIIAGLLDFAGDSHIYSIVFNSTNGPIGKNGEPVFSAYYAGVRSIVINLQQHFNKSLSTAQSNDNCVSLSAIVWYNLITSTLHEMKHAVDLSECDDEATYQIRDDACAVAQTWAHDILLEAAAGGHVDFNMPDLMREPFFGDQIEVTISSILDAVESGTFEPWQKKQAELFETGEVFSLEGQGTKFFMEYLQQLNGTKNIWTTKVNEPKLSPEAEELIVKPEEPMAVGVAAGGPATEPVASAPATPSPHTLETDVPPVQATPVAASVIHTDGSETVVEDAAVTVIENASVMDAEYDPANDVDDSDYEDDTPVPDFAVTPHGLSGDQCQLILATVTHRLHCQFFNKCGYQLNSDVAFTNPGAITEACYIGDIPGASQLIVSYDTLNATGAPINHIPVFEADERKTLPPGNIQGILSKDGTLPAFVFYINVDGRIEKRSLRVQSPTKYEADKVTLKAWSRMLREGTCISVLWRDVPQGSELSPMLGKVFTQGGQNTVVTFNPFTKEHLREFSFPN